MKKIFFYLFFITATGAVAQQKKCFSLDDAVKQTLKAIELKDTSLYMEMYSEEVFLKAVKSSPPDKSDPDSKEKRDYIVSKSDQLKAIHQKAFGALLARMKKDFNTDTYEITFIKYDDNTEEKDGKIVTHDLSILFTINGVSRKLNISVAEYKGCVYYFEPISKVLFDK